MLKFSDWEKRENEKKGYTLTKSSSGLPLFVLNNPLQKDDEPVLLDDEPVKKKKSIPPIVRRVSDFISVSNK